MLKNLLSSKSSVSEDIELSPVDNEIRKQSQKLLELCMFAVENHHKKEFPCRDYLREMLKEATWIKEFLDSVGALKNQKWFPFREAVAAEVLFSKVYYNLLHIQGSVKQYKLLKIEKNFHDDIEGILLDLKEAIVIIARNLIKQAAYCGCKGVECRINFRPCEDDFFGALHSDRKLRHVRNHGQIITYLATKFLNHSENRDIRSLVTSRKEGRYKDLIPAVVDESKLRTVEAMFHNLQSHYDTYIFESDIESQYIKLPFLRGHISIIYHLFESATDLVHYYERHMGENSRKTLRKLDFPLSHKEIRKVIFSFLLEYAGLYLVQAKELCRDMIHDYSETKTIIVPIPNYRGFHVRPSTLIAKIVAHYGSTVTMFLNGTEYDAGMPLDLFRANEDINAYKRRYIAQLISSNRKWNSAVEAEAEKLSQKIHLVLIELVKSNELILYDSNLEFQDLQYDKDDSIGDLASRFIKHYMSTAKLDVRSDLSVEFRGDSRALEDIKLLADHGYGEDKLGNNIDLPENLRYLRE